MRKRSPGTALKYKKGSVRLAVSLPLLSLRSSSRPFETGYLVDSRPTSTLRKSNPLDLGFYLNEPDDAKN